jgi:AraC family transcriptional regulator of adaptative response/methylated-DNA-[protein]-cysteine methyltransferase
MQMSNKKKRTNGVQRGSEIVSLIADTSLGPLLIASTQRGICAAVFAPTREELEEQQQRRFFVQRWAAEATTGMLEDRLRRALQWLDSPQDAMRLFSTPIDLDLQGTPFQRTVWQALLSIPMGQTTTYAAVARQIGNPTAARAVANACGANPVAVLVPCHRVIRGDGGLGGYRWGLSRKRSLLQREAKWTSENVRIHRASEALPRSKSEC